MTVFSQKEKSPGFSHACLIALATTMVWSGHARAANDFTGIGTLGGTSSFAYGMSGDGSVVVGFSYTANNTAIHAVRWVNGAIIDMGSLGGSTVAYGVSADGKTVVGGGYIPNNSISHAFIWTAANGMMDVHGALLGGTNSQAFGVSGNGSGVVGQSDLANGTTHAFLLQNQGQLMFVTDLGTLAGGNNSYAYGISTDGNVAVGQSEIVVNGNTENHAFRYTNTTSIMQDMGTLGGTFSYAYAANSDGSVIVGGSSTAGSATPAPFRWTNGVMTNLGSLGGTWGEATAVSADGSVVVGRSYDGNNQLQAFRWTQKTQMQPVAQWLAGAGVTLPAGWSLANAAAVSADGSIVAGIGTNPANSTEGWIARVSSIGSGLINPAVFNQSVAEAGSRAVRAGVDLPNLTLFGAHHRSLLDSGLARTADGACAWATADGARYDKSGTRSEIAEVGACKDIGSARFGIGIGNAWARQGWNIGGGAKYDGQYLVAEGANRFDNGMEASLTAYWGRFDTDLRRNYQNGANIDTSKGSPDARSAAVRARMDWMDAAQAGSFSLSPYAAYTWMETAVDAYTETGGGFPVVFEKARWRTDDLRAGLAAKTALSATTSLHLAGEVAYRFDDAVNPVKGQVIGLWGFSLPGQQVKQDWIRVAADIDHRLSGNSLLTVGANASTSGSDPSWGVTVGYRASF